LKPGSRLSDAHPLRQAAVFTDAHFDILDGLTAFAEARGRSVVEVALARLLAEPGLAAVLPGAASSQHVRQNALAATMKLSAADIAEIDRIAPSVPNCPDTPSSANGYPV
jgi:aryl-alcohol dehydrogenase-like predicted oxidoreductase